MTLSINAKTYTGNNFAANSVGYNGPTKTASSKDDAQLVQTAPKPTDSFSGLGRTRAKLTRTLTLTGAKTTTGDAIITIDVAVPVGYTGADVDTLLNDMGAFLASATFKTHVKTPQISF
jgi:hypothetical protein